MSDREPIGPPPSDGRPLLRSNDEHAAGALPTSVGVGNRDSSRRSPSPQANKFRVATAVLVGLAIAAIVIAVTAGTHTSKKVTTPPWSAWQPTDTGPLGAREIADHLSPFYRISAVNQLAVVTVVNLTGATATTAANAGNSGAAAATGGLEVAVHTDPSSGSFSLLPGSTIAYNLCGIGGSNCAIGIGQPSASRLLLLKREALEMALYTFKYLSGVDNVVALLPPGYAQAPAAKAKTSTAKGSTAKGSTATGSKAKGSATTGSTAKGSTTSSSATASGGTAASGSSRASSATSPKPVNIALLFIRSELTPWLNQPLAATLPEGYPPTVQAMTNAPEAGLVDQITARGLFTQRLVQAQDGSDLIVLDPLPPQ
jgi:hypothetical protein